MSRSIRISEKHGVNPTIPVCFWCGKEKNEIVLLGKLPGDSEAPRHCIIDYEPCGECEEDWKQGIAIFSVTSNSNGKPEWHGAYPNGKMVVVRREALPEEMQKHPRVFMLEEDFDNTFDFEEDEAPV